MANDLYPVSESDIKKLSGKKIKKVTSKGEEAAVYDVEKNKSNKYGAVNRHLISKLKGTPETGKAGKAKIDWF